MVHDEGVTCTYLHEMRGKSTLSNPNQPNVFQLHPKEIARQLTLIMAENFRAIHPSELVDASWMKEKKKEMASPNLLKHTRFETMVRLTCVHACL